jgi:hypothetical protein
MSKTFTIVKYRKGRETETTGTLAELTKYFGYTLECGHSWNRKISTTPKTAASLVSNLNRSVAETQGSCYDQDSYSLKA